MLKFTWEHEKDVDWSNNPDINRDLICTDSKAFESLPRDRWFLCGLDAQGRQVVFDLPCYVVRYLERISGKYWTPAFQDAALAWIEKKEGKIFVEDFLAKR